MLLWLTYEFRNQYTLHTGPDSGCVLVTNLSTTSKRAPYTGHVLNTGCDSSSGNDTGCAFLDPSNTSFGQDFNLAGGGVFALLWDSSGLQMWHFVRNSIPKDIQNGQPDPSSWTTPVAFWSSVGCNFPSDVQNQHLVINTALGGGWASSDYPNSGCPGTCSDQISIGKNFVSEFLRVSCVSCSADREARCQMGDQLRFCLSVTLHSASRYRTLFVCNQIIYSRSIRLYTPHPMAWTFGAF